MIGATLFGLLLVLGAPPQPSAVPEALQDAPVGRGVGDLSDVVEVTVVNVDIVATDRNG